MIISKSLDTKSFINVKSKCSINNFSTLKIICISKVVVPCQTMQKPRSYASRNSVHQKVSHRGKAANTDQVNLFAKFQVLAKRHIYIDACKLETITQQAINRVTVTLNLNKTSFLQTQQNHLNLILGSFLILKGLTSLNFFFQVWRF